MVRVLCIGNVNLDIILYVDTLPERGSAIHAKRIRTYFGGSASNTAIGLARLGLESGIIGCVGNDVWGKLAIEDFKRENVDVGLLYQVEGETGKVIIIVDSEGERTMIGHPGVNDMLRWQDSIIEYIEKCELVHVSGAALLKDPRMTTTLRILREAKMRGKYTSLDTNTPLAERGLWGLVNLRGLIDILIVNEYEAMKIAGGLDEESLRKTLRWLGARIIVVKLGSKGAAALTLRSRWYAPAFKVKVKDTTGAGDAFNAGLLYALLRGDKVNEALVFANAVAGYKCEGEGARHLPRLRDLEKFLEEKSPYT